MKSLILYVFVLVATELMAYHERGYFYPGSGILAIVIVAVVLWATKSKEQKMNNKNAPMAVNPIGAKEYYHFKSTTRFSGCQGKEVN
jgi:hypothetical protein